MSGSNLHGERYIPKILERYFSTISEPLAVFKCRSDIQCPGGCRELVVEALKGFLVVSAQLTHFGLTTHALPVGAGLRLAGFWR